MRAGLIAAILLGVGLRFQVFAVSPRSADFELRTTWLREYTGSNSAARAFSFACGGQTSGPFAPGWKLESESQSAVAGGANRTLIFSDPVRGLRARWEVTEYTNHPALEWVVRLENRGTQHTPLLEAIQVLDISIPHATNASTLHYARGALCSFDDFQPLTQTFQPGTRVQLQAGGGRSSSDFLPFFNLASPSGGIIVGIGWSGEWGARFEAETSTRMHIRAGQALTRLKLAPGESIRTPRIAVLFYEGDWIRGQNLWRRFVLDQHRPRVNGRPFDLPLFNGNWGGTSAEHHLANIRALAEHDLPVEFYWIDAEWFGEGPWFLNPGNWQPKKGLYPEGFKPLAEVLHASGRKLLLWFEPEARVRGHDLGPRAGPLAASVPRDRRVYRWEKQTYPDWVKSESLRNQIKENDRLFNLGHPQARQFLTDFISGRINEWGLDCYRHDANIAPLEFWRAADSPDRQGITEIRWVEGLYAFWDELLRRHPGLIIDNCASGGRQIDLETMSRSLPLWRTDFPGDPLAKQCHTYGVSFWVPLNSTGGVNPSRDSSYALRSSLSSTLAFGLFGNGDAPQPAVPPADFPFARAKAALAQCRELQRYFLGDYYPLTDYSKARDSWMAWQFDLPDKGEGMIQAFRREESPYGSARLKLHGLEAHSLYALRNFDSGQRLTLLGRDLLGQGLPVAIQDRPGAIVLTYSRAK